MPDQIPLDATRLQLLGTGSVAEHFEYDSAAGKRKTEQTRNDSGVLVWVLDLLMVGAGKPEVIGVTVPAPTRPEFHLNQVVELERLTASCYAQQKGRAGMQIAWRYEAAGIKGGGKQHHGDQKAA